MSACFLSTNDAINTAAGIVGFALGWALMALPARRKIYGPKDPSGPEELA